MLEQGRTRRALAHARTMCRRRTQGETRLTTPTQRRTSGWVACPVETEPYEQSAGWLQGSERRGGRERSAATAKRDWVRRSGGWPISATWPGRGERTGIGPGHRDRAAGDKKERADERQGPATRRQFPDQLPWRRPLASAINALAPSGCPRRPAVAPRPSAATPRPGPPPGLASSARPSATRPLLIGPDSLSSDALILMPCQRAPPRFLPRPFPPRPSFALVQQHPGRRPCHPLQFGDLSPLRPRASSRDVVQPAEQVKPVFRRGGDGCPSSLGRCYILASVTLSACRDATLTHWGLS